MINISIQYLLTPWETQNSNRAVIIRRRCSSPSGSNPIFLGDVTLSQERNIMY